MKYLLLWIWQLPQHLLALAIFAVLRLLGKINAVCVFKPGYPGHDRHINVDFPMGLSLGNYIFVQSGCSETTENHERGHSVQSLYLGPLYLLIIGLPSLTGNIYDRICHKGSSWYYKQPWEAWADKLGGVVRK